MTPLVGYPWDEVRRLGLPPADYAVFGSVPLLACGLIQEVSDLDLLARGAAWAKAQTLGEAVRAPHGDVVIQLPNRIDIFNGWLGLDADTIID